MKPFLPSLSFCFFIHFCLHLIFLGFGQLGQHPSHRTSNPIKRFLVSSLTACGYCARADSWIFPKKAPFTMQAKVAHFPLFCPYVTHIYFFFSNSLNSTNSTQASYICVLHQKDVFQRGLSVNARVTLHLTFKSLPGVGGGWIKC